MANRKPAATAHAIAAWCAAAEAVTRLIGRPPPPASRGVLLGGRRCTREEAWARKLAVYTASTGLNVRLTDLTALAGPNRMALTRWAEELETARDDPAMDGFLEALAVAARAALAAGSMTPERLAQMQAQADQRRRRGLEAAA